MTKWTVLGLSLLATATFLLAYKGLQGCGPGHGTLAYAAAGLGAGLAALTRWQLALSPLAPLPARLRCIPFLWPRACISRAPVPSRCSHIVR